VRIFLVVVYYLPSPKSSATLFHDLGRELSMRGHTISIITTSDSIDAPWSLSLEDGMEVLRIRSGKIDGSNLIIRFINEFFLSFVILFRGRSFFKSRSCDLVIWYSPSIFFSHLIYRLKVKYNCGTYLVLRDIFPQWALDTGVLREGFVFRLLKYFEVQQYKYADVVGVQSPKNMNYFKENDLFDELKLEVLYNWFSLRIKDLPERDYRAELNLSDKVVFFYGGNFGVAQDLDNLVNLAKSLSSFDTARILLVGDGSESIRLKKLILDLELKNIIIMDSVPQDEYFGILSQMDVGLISLDRKFKTHNFPGKMLGYMYYSKPILASINAGNDLQDIIEDYNVGLVCVNGDDEKLFSNAMKLVNDIDVRRVQGENGNKLLHDLFSVKSAANQILSHF
jgi:glycosyltransferase involved in cell wall biosynthesis